MSSQATEKKKDFVGTIAAVVMSMGAVFAVLQAILPAGLTPAIATLALGLVLTGALVWANFLSLQTAGLTWAGTSIVLVIVHLIISRPATINGYVIDVNGNPVVGQALVLNDSSGVDHRVITDNAGRFEIRNVPEGRYTLITDAGKLLLAGEVSPGWKRFVSPKVEVGSLPISLANLSTPTATPEVAMLPSDMPPVTYTFTPTWTPEFTWTPTFTFTPSYTPTITPTRTPRPTSTPRPSSTPSPTPTNIPEEKILLNEDFEDGEAQGFIPERGVWYVVTDENNNQVYDIDASNGNWPEVYFGSREWQDYRIEYRFRILENQWTNYSVGLNFRWVNGQPYYAHIFLPFLQGPNWQTGFNFVSDSWQEIGGGFQDFPLELGRWYSVRVDAQDTHLQMFLDGVLMLDVSDTRVSNGGLGLGIGSGTHAQFDDIRVSEF